MPWWSHLIRRPLQLFMMIFSALLFAHPAHGESAEDVDSMQFPWFSVAPTIGFGYLFESDEIDTGLGYDPVIEIPARPSLDLKLNLDLGGDGFGFNSAPFVRFERGESASFNVYGIELGVIYRLHFGSIYPQIGLGVHLAYLGGRDSEAGFEAMGRIPIGVTWYQFENVAWFAEFGLMYGVTGLIGTMFPDFETGNHWGIDIALGVRLPKESR